MDDLKRQLTDACKQDYLKTVKRLHRLHPDHINPHRTYGFAEACIRGSLRVAKFLIESEDRYSNIDIHIHDDGIFWVVCMRGLIDAAKFLISLERTHGKINIHVKGFGQNEPFVNYAYKHQYLSVLKLYRSLEESHGRIPKNDIATSFSRSLRKKSFEVMQFWVDNYAQDIAIVEAKTRAIREEYERGFQELCTTKNYQLIKFLLSLDSFCIDIHSRNDYAFYFGDTVVKTMLMKYDPEYPWPWHDFVGVGIMDLHKGILELADEMEALDSDIMDYNVVRLIDSFILG